MKRKHLLNKIISLTIITTLYLSMSASAFADVETDIPVASSEEVVQQEEGSPEDVLPEENTVDETEPSVDEETVAEDGKGGIKQVIETVAENFKELMKKGDEPEAVEEDPQTPEELPGESDDEKAEEPKEPEAGDTYFEIITKDDGTTVKTIYEYVINEETGELEPVIKEEIEGLFDENGNPVEEKECEHELVYISNKDGTHKVTCSKCEMEEYTESCQFDENGICVKCGFKRLPDPILVYEDEDVIVRVEGAVPEKSDLRVTPIKEDVEETKEAYENVESQLLDKTKDEDYVIRDFLAYDICFINQESGEEVEPDGDVKVSLEYKGEILPKNDARENIIKEDVLIQHFNEKTDELENLTGDGKAVVDTKDNLAVTSAEFTSDTFSTYLITWVETQQRVVKLGLKNKLEDGTELVPGTNTRTLNPPTSSSAVYHDISEFVNENVIDGYTFTGAKYNGTKITRVSITYTTSNQETNYTIHLLDGNREITSVSTSSRRPQIEVDIDLFYKADTRLIVSNVATGSALIDTTTSYIYQILDEAGNPLADLPYESDKNSSNNIKTNEEGKFILAPGETVQFHNLNDGTYTVKEAEISGKYQFKNFITRIYVSGNMEKEIQPDSLASRAVQVTLTEANIPSIKFKNCYTETNIYPIQDVNRYKFIKYIPSADNYELTFQFKGPEERVETIVNDQESYDVAKKKNVDIVLVVDKSNSMRDDPTNSNTKNIDYVINAVQSMVSVFESKDDVDAKWKVVDFGTTAKLVSGRWINTEDVNSTIKREFLGGTNYQAGLTLAQSELTSGGRADAEKIVIFITDGHPTQYGASGESGGGNYTNVATYNAAMTAAEGINCSQFYVIGMNLGRLSVYDYSAIFGIPYVSFSEDAKVFLDKLAGKATASKKEAYSIAANQVGTLFEGLAGTISSESSGSIVKVDRYNYASHVTMVDKLSDYVEIVPGSEFRISVSHGEDDSPVLLPGNPEEPRTPGKISEDGLSSTPAFYYLENNQTLKAEYDSSTKTMTLIFPDDYELSNGYLYSVKMVVQASDEAYEKYIELGNSYNATGDTGTDHITAEQPTSAGKPGFYSNDEEESKTYFTYKGVPDFVEFPKPVIQVYMTNEWEIYKTDNITVIDDEEVPGSMLKDAKFNLIEIGDETTETKTYSGTSTDEQSKEGLVEWALDEGETITTAKTYKLVETDAPAGYIRNADYWMITLDADNKPTIEKFDKSGVSQGEYIVTPRRSGKVITYRFYFKNDKNATNLPNTGGGGTTNTRNVGIMLMFTSAYVYYLYYLRQKRSRK